jgi:flagellar protein FlgJ
LAISTPGDIVLDVVRAADPASVEAARTKLASFASRSTGATFSVDGGASADGASPARDSGGTPEAFAKFEAMVLQTFIHSMLPKDTESVYGEGMAGEMWQSLLAEQLGAAVSARGGIGIADRILKDHYYAGEQKVSLTGASNSIEAGDQASKQMMSVALVQEIQRTMARALHEDMSHSSAPTSR